MAKREKLYTVLLLLVSFLVALALAESALRMVYPKSDIFPAEPAKDPILGHKILPYQTGHDANGFRNDSAKGRFPIAARPYRSNSDAFSARRSTTWAWAATVPRNTIA